MNSVSVIGVHTPEQTEALQAATGLLVTIGRNGARLVKPEDFKGLLDPYEQTDRDAWLGNPGESKGAAA